MRMLFIGLRNTLLLIVCCIAIGACSASQSTVNVASSSVTEPEIALDRSWIEANIIGNTISGKSKFPKWGVIPFQMYFNPNQNIYQDRIVVRRTVNLASGTFSLPDGDMLCRISRTRNDNMETCWRFTKRGSEIVMRNIETNQLAVIETAPGKAF